MQDDNFAVFLTVFNADVTEVNLTRQQFGDNNILAGQLTRRVSKADRQAIAGLGEVVDDGHQRRPEEGVAANDRDPDISHGVIFLRHQHNAMLRATFRAYTAIESVFDKLAPRSYIRTAAQPELSFTIVFIGEGYFLLFPVFEIGNKTVNRDAKAKYTQQ